MKEQNRQGRRRPLEGAIRCARALAPALLLLGGCNKEKKPEQLAQSASLSPSLAPPPAPPPEPSFPPVPAPPAALGSVKVPEGHELSPAKVALGNQLFFDKRLSADGSVACISCHQNEDGTGGHDPIGVGAKQQKLTRHSPMLWNVGFLPALYWDGRAADLEAQMKAAWAGANMGVGKENLNTKAAELAALPEYTDLFEFAFPGEDVTGDHVAEAVASYERTLFCGDTAYDKFIAGDATALSAEQKAGWDLFQKTGCLNCHTPPFFSDAYLTPGGAFHNVGVGLKGKKPEEADVGRQSFSKEERDFAAFKTPSLRNVSKTAPYFHDGSVAELTDAVRFMGQGGYKNKNRDEKLKDQKLSDAQVQAIVSFLGSLACQETLQKMELKRSP